MLGRARQTLRVVAAGASADDRHADRTAEILRRLGADEEVVTAGLMHDVAKPPGTRLWHRIAGVLLARIALGEPLSAAAAAGGTLILAGVLLLVREERTANAPRTSPSIPTA